MSQDGPQKESSPEKPAAVNGSLEIIPEAKKEDSPDHLPLQISAVPEKKVQPAPQETSQDQRVMAACELPLAASPEVLKAAITADIQQPAVPADVIPPPNLPEEPEKKVCATPQAQNSPLQKQEPKSVKHSAKPTPKNASKKGGSSSKMLEKEAKPAKESLYNKVLKEYHPTAKKPAKNLNLKSTSKQLLPDSQNLSERSIDPEQKAMFLQMRESLLMLQKKDAVTRQAVEKMQKEKRALEDEKKHKEQLIVKCEKTRATDGCTIAKQEEIIAKLRINQQATIERTLITLYQTSTLAIETPNKLEAALAENAKLLELVSLLKGCKDISIISSEKLESYVSHTIHIFQIV